MSVNFVEYFANEHNGYDVLYQNMKYGLIASKELSEFLRERSGVEETNSKLLAKLAKQANGNCAQGTFAPFWGVLKCSAEKLSTLHQHMFQKVSELVKDVAKYADDLHKKHKAVKDSESSTLEVVLLTQNTKQALQKAKDIYSAKSSELDKLRKDSASAKEIEKAELKLKKMHEEYRMLYEKYNLVKQDFEKKMTQTCKHFQDVEEAHLKAMKNFVSSYADLIQNNHNLMGQVHRDFKHQCLEMTVEKLLEQFLLEKYSVMEKTSLSGNKPGSANNSISEPDQISNVSNGSHKQAAPAKAPKKEPSFASKSSRRTTSLLNLFTPNFQSKEEPSGGVDGAAPCSAPSSPSGTPGAPPIEEKDDSMGRNPLRESKWFLRSRRTKTSKNNKKTKKKKDEITETNPTDNKSDLEEKDEETQAKATQPVNSPEVDEDGYCVRPKDEKGSVYSSSDSDSEEERDRKIRVEIKPLSNGGAPMSASVDELRATVENISLYKTGTTQRRGSNANASKASSDLLDLNFFQSPSGSNPTSPHGTVTNPYAPLQTNLQSNFLESPTPMSNPDVGDLFSEVSDIANQSTIRTSTPTMSTIALPRPPSRRSEGDFRTAGASGSRGPSPLTIGMADTIPLAVAFHEIIHSFFRGTEESKCQVKMSGDMMLSFPTGIVGVLANNPNPAKLCFRLKNIHRLDNVLPNKQLITINTTMSSRDSTVLEFNMSALTSLLKRQCDKNPNAAYFNVDILKYQVKPKFGAASCPFQLVAYWKCEKAHTDLKVDYKYNMHAMSSPSPLLNVSVVVPIRGKVKNVIAMPHCTWNPENEQALWRFTELSQHSDDKGVGSLRARFELDHGPSSKSIISSQFNCEGATLSGIEFELVGSGYRLSLVKRRFVSGKYICDSEGH